MDIDKSFFRKITLIFPKRYRESYRENLDILDIKTTETKRLGLILISTLFIFFLQAIFVYLFFPGVILQSIGFGLFGVICVFILDYLYIYFKLEDRKEKIETVLPDFLHLISSNLRAGQTPFQALKSSARDEFGPLKTEIDRATTKALGSASFEQSLKEMHKRVNSNLFRRVINLFTTSMKAGSHMAELMEETANDIAETRNLKKALSTGTKTYTMFILFTVVIGSPLLFSISSHFTDIMEDMKAPETASPNADFGLNGLSSGGFEISSDFILKMSLFMIITTSIFSSILIGVISHGTKLYGLRYAPAICAVSVTIFFISRYLVGIMF